MQCDDLWMKSERRGGWEASQLDCENYIFLRYEIERSRRMGGPPIGKVGTDGGVRKKCQPDKMPTGQNAYWTKCQPKVGILFGLSIVVGILSVPILVGILSRPSQHVMAFCQNREKCQ